MVGRKKIIFTIYLMAFLIIMEMFVIVDAWSEPSITRLGVYIPMVNGMLSVSEQKTSANYIYKNVSISTNLKEKFYGYDSNTVNSLISWMNAYMSDGRSDVLVIIDMCPYAIFHGESDDSLAERWLKNGNMIIWTGSEPFGTYINTEGQILSDGAEIDGASKILDVSSPGLCRGGGLQIPTTAVQDYVNPNKLAFDGQYNHGDYNISSFVSYEARYALKYDQLLIDALSSDWNHMSYWRPEEVFAEDSENYQSDNIILVNTDNGRYGQFYCLSGYNDARMMVITQVLNNWAKLPCRTLVVSKTPKEGEFSSIQAALNAADRRDTVLVKEGTYYEQIKIPKRGIKIVSDPSDGGNDLLVYENFGPDEGFPHVINAPHRRSRAEDYGMPSKMVLRRTLRTIIDGSIFPDEDLNANPPVLVYPMVEFPKGATIGTLLDGFTIQRMPNVNHTIPGHSHVVQTRGASGTIINCIVRNNGSSGLGSHAVMWGEPVGPHDPSSIDFRWQNIKYDAHPILINNVVHDNKGNNLGNNHYSYAIMYNNECFESITVEDHEAPGIGCQHGAHPLIVGNLVYKSSWVGIGCRKGPEQGIYPVNRPTHPIVRNNWVFDAGLADTSNGEWAGEHGAGIGGDDTGGYDPKKGQFVYHIIEGNYVNGSRNASIGCRSKDPAYSNLPPDAGEYPTDLGFVKIVDNTVTRAGMLSGEPVSNGWDKAAGIGINGAYAIEISRNTSYGNKDAGIGIRGGVVETIDHNVCFENGAAGIGMCEGSFVSIIHDNELHHNGKAGIGHDGSEGRVRVSLESSNHIIGNGAAGIGIVASDITEIRGMKNTLTPDIQNNAGPAIAVIDGSTVGTIADMILDHNGILNNTTSLSVLNSSSASIKDSTITYCGKTCMSIFHPGTTVTIENCNLDHSGQSGGAPVLTVQDGATAMIIGSSISYSSGAPNVTVFGNATLNMFGCNVHNSGTPGLEAADSTIRIQNSIFEESGTRGIMAQRCDIALKRVIIRDSGIGGGASFDSCTGSVKECEMYNNWPNELSISNSTMDIIGNVFHDHININPTIDILNNSHVNLYHNTISNLYNGEPAGTIGIRVDESSSADIRNNIIYRCLTGILGNLSTITASTNNYYVVKDGILGSNVLWANPLLLEDYSLEPYSLCIDAGELIIGINDDFNGSAPDIGAKEFMGTRENLYWKTPSLTVDARDGSYNTAEFLRDDNLNTGMNWGSPWVVYDIGGENGKSLKIYGFRFYTGSTPTDWKIYVSDNFAGPWTLVSGAFPIKIGLNGPGFWDENWSNIVVPGRYVKIEKVYGPSPQNSVYEFDVLVSDLTVDSDIIVIDNRDALISSGWTLNKSSGYGGDHLVAPAGAGTVVSQWTPSIPSSGDYDVYVRWTADVNRATNVPYTVNYNSGSQSFFLNQQINGGQWVSLGTFPFAEGNSGNVMVSNNANGFVCADAVMFIRR